MTEPLPADAPSTTRARGSRLRRADAPALVWAGMAGTALGFAMILVAWALLAGEDDVQDQLPPLVGVGLLGLAVVLGGLALLIAAVLRRDGAQRQRQLDQLSAAVAALRAAEATGAPTVAGEPAGSEAPSSRPRSRSRARAAR